MLPVVFIGKMYEYHDAEEDEKSQSDKMHFHPFPLGYGPACHSHPDILEECKNADPGVGDGGDDIERKQIRYVLWR